VSDITTVTYGGPTAFQPSPEALAMGYKIHMDTETAAIAVRAVDTWTDREVFEYAMKRLGLVIDEREVAGVIDPAMYALGSRVALSFELDPSEVDDDYAPAGYSFFHFDEDGKFVHLQEIQA
jgi:hypothetical protein